MGKVTFKKAVEDYLAICEVTQAREHIRRKEIRLLAINEQLPKDVQDDVAKLEDTHLAKVINGRKKDGMSAVLKDIQILRAFCGYLRMKGVIQNNPMEGIQTPRIETGKVVYYQKQDVDRLIDAAEGLEKKYLQVLKLTLARVNEINRLQWDDVDFQNGIVWLGRKGSTTKPRRYLEMGSNLKEVLQAIPKNGSPFIFGGWRDKRKAIKNIAKKAGLGKKWWRGFHGIRRGMATHLVDEEQALINDVSDILGHRSLTHTKVYLQRNGSRIRGLQDRL